MKILFVNQTPFVSPLGAERSALNAAIGLSERGHEIAFLYCDDIAKQQTHEVRGEIFTSYSVNYKHIHPEFNMESAAITLKRWLQDQDMSKYDIIHSHNSAAHVAIEEAGIEVPTIGTVRDYRWLCEGDAMCLTEYGCLKTCNSPFQQLRCSFSLTDRSISFLPILAGQTAYRVRFQKKILDALENMSHIVAISDFLKRILIQNTDLESNRISTIYNSIIEDDYNSNVDVSRNKVLFVGSLKPQKGILEAIQAFNQVSNTNSRSQLLVAGDGRLRDKSEELTRILGLENEVIFKGHVERGEIIDLYNQASLVIYPSLWPEPFGRISIEAMASQTPIVGSKHGAIPEVLDNWPGSQIVDPRDGKEFSKAILNQLCGHHSQVNLNINEKYLHSTSGVRHEKLYRMLSEKQ